ncbi:MAG TPA: HlyD family efflux transporter periplasmic adaptor subunit [Rhizomicrobium sp.]|nr:HlyD family efflux transporter periplasmic adaptor subunit [Rhizomicrobium sp.]
MSDTSSLSDRYANASPRQKLLGLVGIVVVVAAIAYGAYWFFYVRYFETTDDAYVSGDTAMINSRTIGTILAIHADNTQAVKRGQLLVELDPLPAEVAMQAAQADLANAARNVRALFAKADEQRAQLAQAQAQLAQTQQDYKRRVAAVGDGAVSAEDLSHARHSLDESTAATTAAQHALAQTLAQIQGTDVADNPQVLAAEARLRKAAIDLDYTRLTAPIDGVVAQRSAGAGDQVAVGTPLMAVVPLATVWVDANFKEVQLRRMRIGQPATVTADIYGSSVTYHGRVAGLAAGSGDAFALLPPQNASGNWIKIVQRLPVRIEFDKRELGKHPLRIGLSTSVRVDTRNQSGPLLSETVRSPVSSDSTERISIARANALIARIVATNGGKANAEMAP